jgi:hypothetical protein
MREVWKFSFRFETLDSRRMKYASVKKRTKKPFLSMTVGSHRPSPMFHSEGRERKFKGVSMDMCNKPAPWFDGWKGSKREGCHKLPTYGGIDTGHLQLFENHRLMLPSERLAEHKALKAGIQNWQKGRNELFEFKKQKRILERKHPNGMLGIDGPLRPDTELYAERCAMFKAQDDASHADIRREFLGDMTQSSDCFVKKYGEDLLSRI